MRDGRFREFAAFGWDPNEVPDPQAPETSLLSKLNWDERSQEPHVGLLEWHDQLIRLRRQLPALSAGWFDPVRVRYDEGERWLVMERGPLFI